MSDRADASAEVSADADLLRAFLVGRSLPCPVCGYDLRDLRADRCPECGRALRLTVAEDRPTRGPFVVGLVALAAPPGASLCALSGLCYWWLVGRAEWAFMIAPLVANAVVLALGVPALVLWLRHARRLRRQPARRQWAWAAAACAVVLVGHIVFLLFVW